MAASSGYKPYLMFDEVTDFSVSPPVFKHQLLKDPHAKVAPNRCQRALSTPLQPNHTINTINSNTYHLLEKVTKIHKRQVYNPKNEYTVTQKVCRNATKIYQVRSLTH